MSASIVQLGGQTPLGLAEKLEKAGVPIVGTSPKAIDLAEDRGAFGEVLNTAGLPAPRFGTATSFEQARRIAADIGYPVLVRPSYVLGGRGMEIVYDEDTLQGYITRATELSPEHPVLVDRFLEDAIEIDVDALCDGTEVYIGGVMEHIEEAGIHSGDSACALPPVTLGRSDIESVRTATEAIAHGIGVVGLLNVQYALKDDVLYVLEANPRASRTVPFVSKATAIPLAKACARIMLGASIAQLREEGVLAATGDGGDDAAQRPGGGEGGGAAVPPLPQGRRLQHRLAWGRFIWRSSNSAISSSSFGLSALQATRRTLKTTAPGWIHRLMVSPIALQCLPLMLVVSGKSHPAKVCYSTPKGAAEGPQKYAQRTGRRVAQTRVQIDRCHSGAPRWLRFDNADSGLGSSDGCGHERQTHSPDSVPGPE